MCLSMHACVCPCMHVCVCVKEIILVGWTCTVENTQCSSDFSHCVQTSLLLYSKYELRLLLLSAAFFMTLPDKDRAQCVS